MTIQTGSTRQRDSLVITQHKRWDQPSGTLHLPRHSTSTMSMKDKQSPMRNITGEPEEIKGNNEDGNDHNKGAGHGHVATGAQGKMLTQVPVRKESSPY